MKIGNKIFGKCVICKQQKELTKEHIPPKCSFNKDTVKAYNMFEIIEKDILPWEKDKFSKYELHQGGYSKYCLCKECNNKTGALYTKAYRTFAWGLHEVIVRAQLQTNQYLDISKARIKPLNIIKQIISNFNSLNPDFFQNYNFNVKEFLLNANNRQFLSNVHFYIYLTKSFIQLPIQGQFNVITGKNLMCSEIAHYPLGIIMAIDCELDNECCIDDFLKYEYDQEADIACSIQMKERIFPFIRDYRTKADFGITD